MSDEFTVVNLGMALKRQRADVSEAYESQLSVNV
jgi:hypothetical protein